MARIEGEAGKFSRANINGEPTALFPNFDESGEVTSTSFVLDGEEFVLGITVRGDMRSSPEKIQQKLNTVAQFLGQLAEAGENGALEGFRRVNIPHEPSNGGSEIA